jgi:hypothetical protein
MTMSLVTKKTRIKIDLPKEEAQPVVVEETDTTAAAKNTKSKPRKTAKIETADAGLSVAAPDVEDDQADARLSVAAPDVEDDQADARLSVAAPDVEDDQADTVVEPALKRKPVKFKSDPSSVNISKPADTTAAVNPRVLDEVAYAEALSQAFVLSDHDLRRLLVHVELAIAKKDPDDAIWLNMELQSKNLLMLKAIDWKLWEMYNKFVR